MCNCKALPTYIADPYYKGIGVQQFQSHFSQLDTEGLTPEFREYEEEGGVYFCTVCEQHWYIELTTEEQPSPLFALKVDSDAKPNQLLVEATKQFLSLLAHGGFDTSLCKQSGCYNFALRGRALCHLHFSFL